uniref:Uncharacterized protein n=1 Tax=Cacopsylla melanoneura TaxID=428564 RepID=A0A8D8W269_9HEMI
MKACVGLPRLVIRYVRLLAVTIKCEYLRVLIRCVCLRVVIRCVCRRVVIESGSLRAVIKCAHLPQCVTAAVKSIPLLRTEQLVLLLDADHPLLVTSGIRCLTEPLPRK